MGTILFLLAAGIAADVQVAEDRMLVVDGQRTFVLGLYEYPKEKAALKQAADAGVNLMYVHSTEELDALQALGMKGWVNTGYDLDLSVDREAREAALKAKADQFAAHPAMMVWEVPDEALWNVWYAAQEWRFNYQAKQQREAIAAITDEAQKTAMQAQFDDAQRTMREGLYVEGEAKADELSKTLGLPETQPAHVINTAADRMVVMAEGMKAGYAALKQLDPKHPIWMNHAPRNSIPQLAMFAQAADAVGCDIYPMPDWGTGHSDLGDRSRTSVGAYTRRMQESAPGKPVFMVLQGFGWADLDKNADEATKKRERRPTLAETRYMAYDTIVNGARGILYWGTAFIEKDSQLWADVLKVLRELADLQPVLSAPEAAIALEINYAETWGSVDRGVRVLPKQAADGLWLIVVNEWQDPLHCTLSGVPDGTYTDKDSGKAFVAAGGKVTFTVGSYGTGVLKHTP